MEQASQEQRLVFQRWLVGVIVVVLVAVVVAIALTRYRKRRREERYMADLRHSELKALRAQINPHFIFNALSSIQRYILNHHAVEANRYLTKFSRFIRLVLYNSDKHVISVADELMALQQYLDIEKLRLGDQFSYSIEADDTLSLDCPRCCYRLSWRIPSGMGSAPRSWRGIS